MMALHVINGMLSLIRMAARQDTTFPHGHGQCLQGSMSATVL